MRSEELLIRLRLPRWTKRRWLIVGAIMAVSVAAVAAPMFTDGMTLKAADLNALADGIAPSGMVSYFNLAVCPAGWNPLTSAQGRYLVGVPAGGLLGAAKGMPLSDQEDRPVGQHAHSVTDPGHSHSYLNLTQGQGNGVNTNNLVGSSQPTSTSKTGITVDNSGAVAGTNAPYLQLLVCQKN